MQSLSPGKLILSGEYAVLYDKPALAVAINRFATTRIIPEVSKLISLDLLNLRYQKTLTVEMLRAIKKRVSAQYKKFLKNHCSIKDVLQAPFELAQFVIIYCLDHLCAHPMKGLSIQTESTIPIGCGMGSSAALVLSVLHAIASYLGLKISTDRYLAMGKEIENLQHGKSSGLDLLTSLHGGCVYFKEDQARVLPAPRFSLFVINTGTPEISTGECVAHINKKFKQDAIWQDFEAITNAFAKLLSQENNFKFSEMQKLIHENHKLLKFIGVVPSKVQQFIGEIEKQGATAKICGSGAISGNSAGIVWVATETPEQVNAICDHYGYTLQSISTVSSGVHSVNA